MPDISERREHTLSLQYEYGCPTRETLLAVAKEWQVSGAAECLDEIVQVVGKFRATATRLAVRGRRGLDLISADVRRRVELLRGEKIAPR